jgi:hypothetical protein
MRQFSYVQVFIMIKNYQKEKFIEFGLSKNENTSLGSSLADDRELPSRKYDQVYISI